jgi:hypothetical protein
MMELKLFMESVMILKSLVISTLLVGSAFANSIEQKASLKIQEELNLSEVERLEIESTLKDEPNPYAKGRVFFCAQSGISAIIDALVLNCRNVKGERHRVSFIGIGASIGMHGGLAVMYPKRKSRNFRTGTYNGEFRAVHLGLGMIGLKFTNENKSINFRVRGLSLGIGFNAANGILTIDK